MTAGYTLVAETLRLRGARVHRRRRRRHLFTPDRRPGPTTPPWTMSQPRAGSSLPGCEGWGRAGRCSRATTYERKRSRTLIRQFRARGCSRIRHSARSELLPRISARLRATLRRSDRGCAARARRSPPNGMPPRNSHIHPVHFGVFYADSPIVAPDGSARTARRLASLHPQRHSGGASGRTCGSEDGVFDLRSVSAARLHAAPIAEAESTSSAIESPQQGNAVPAYGPVIDVASEAGTRSLCPRSRAGAARSPQSHGAANATPDDARLVHRARVARTPLAPHGDLDLHDRQKASYDRLPPQVVPDHRTGP